MQPLIVDNLTTPDTGFELKTYKEKSFHLPWHMHPTYELTFIECGKGQRLIGNHIASFQKGDMLLLAPGIPHAWKSHKEAGQYSVKALTLKFKEDFPCPEFWQHEAMEAVNALLKQSHQAVVIDGALNIEIARRLASLLNQTRARQVTGILEILVLLSESATLTTLLPGDQVYQRGSHSVEAKRAIDYIFRYYDQPIDASTLAEISQVHPSSLGRLFRRTTGSTPTDFINQVRINYACQLLSETNEAIVDICHRCGYQNLSYFNRVFKQINDASPSQYRKDVRRGFS